MSTGTPSLESVAQLAGGGSGPLLLHPGLPALPAVVYTLNFGGKKNVISGFMSVGFSFLFVWMIFWHVLGSHR